MVSATATPIIGMSDGVPLKLQLRRVERMRKLKAVGLVLPLFLFIAISFVLPLIYMLRNAVYDPDIRDNLPRTVQALDAWDGNGTPDEAAYAALAADLRDAQKNKTAALIGKRLNYEISGIRSKIIATARKAATLEAAPYKEALIGMDPAWGDRNTWATIKRSGHAVTHAGSRPFSTR